MNRNQFLGLALSFVLLATLLLWQRGFRPRLPTFASAPASATVAYTNSTAGQTAAEVTKPMVTNGTSPASAQPRGEIVGIGAALGWDRAMHCPKVMNVLPNSPAARGGLSPGWLISKIDDLTPTNLTLQDCIRLIQGAPGSKVRLEMINVEEGATNIVELVRQKIPI